MSPPKPVPHITPTRGACRDGGRRSFKKEALSLTRSKDAIFSSGSLILRGFPFISNNNSRILGRKRGGSSAISRVYRGKGKGKDIYLYIEEKWLTS